MTGPSGARPKLLFFEHVAIALMVAGLVVLALYGAGSSASFGSGLQLIAGLAMIASAALSVGGILGFLFGVPRYRAVPDNQGAQTLLEKESKFAPNTNLEQISDWLTKIIIGASLVNIQELASLLVNASSQAANLLKVDSAGPVIMATIIFNISVGFIWGYLWSSSRIRAMLEGG